MRIALDPAMLNTRPIEEVPRSVSEAGYGHLELSNRDDFIPAFGGVRASRQDLARLRRAATKAGVEIGSVAVIQAWSSPDEDVRSQAVAWWRDGIAAVAELGCQRINTEMSGDPGRPAECAAAFRRSVDELLPLLEREGFEVAAEPHPYDFVETAIAGVDLIRSIGSSRIQYLHCVPHTFHLGGTIASQIEYARGSFDHVHVADTFRPERIIVNPPGSGVRVHQHFDIGQGELDWEEVARALRAVGFDGLLTVQVFCWDERAAQSFRHNHEAVERLFGGPRGASGPDVDR
jgi:myo-inositol catabolism protein IolH